MYYIHVYCLLCVADDGWGKAAMIAEEGACIHCFGDTLNLVISDTIKQSQVTIPRHTLLELVKLIKFSPKCMAMQRNLKEEICNHVPGVHKCCCH